jgi:hypothetical protein
MPDQPPQSARKTYATPAKPSDIDRAVFLGNAATDNLFTAVTAMAAELWAVRRRQKIVEALLEKRGVLTVDAIEHYTPTADETEKWQADRDVFVRMIYEPFKGRGDIPYHSSLKFEPKS